MKRTLTLAAITAAPLAGLTGCLAVDAETTEVNNHYHESSPYVGTWKSTTDDTAAGFNIGSMTLAPDGTFTAYAVYGRSPSQTQFQGFNGDWTIRNGDLILNDGERRYDLELSGSSMTITDKQSGLEARLRRMNPRN